MNTIRLIWRCTYCDDVCISYSNLMRSMDTCDCGKTSVDLEEHYQRSSGSSEDISRKEFVDGKWQQIK